MAHQTDPQADADYHAFLDALARQGLPRRAEAARATEAVACALALRLRDPHFDPLRELLPGPLKGRLLPCERHGAGPPRMIAGLDGFLDVVAEDLGSSRMAAEPYARAVFGAMRSQLLESEEEEVARRLPGDLAPLWILTS